MEEHILALPKGRILEEATAVLEAAGMAPEADFFDEGSRALKFSSARAGLRVIKVRSFDVAAFVSYGAAAFGIAGSDVVDETARTRVYSPIDLRIGRCRLSVAAVEGVCPYARADERGYAVVATKYPTLAAEHFAGRGVRAECVKLHGAMELAPILHMCDCIVDLVSTGRTLKENGLTELEKVADVSSRFIVNRAYYKLYPKQATAIVKVMEEARDRVFG
ncbi:MAG: ATP phosphoribosyltransferase [Rickettsiales bacterium]